MVSGTMQIAKAVDKVRTTTQTRVPPPTHYRGHSGMGVPLHVQRVEVKDTVKQPIMHNVQDGLSTTKNYPVQNANSPKVEKSCTTSQDTQRSRKIYSLLLKIKQSHWG